MKLSRKTNTIIMWVLAVGLLVGMVVMFTPTAGTLFGGRQDTLETPVVFVNNQPITDQHVASARQNNPAFTAVQEGEVGDDLQLLLIDGLIDRELLRQASANQRVSSADVREAVNAWRRDMGVAGRQNDQAYLAAIGRLGHTDASFRQAMEAQLRQQRYLDSLTADVTVSDEEVHDFYEVNRRAYQSEERVRARQIVVEDEELAQELYVRAQDGEDVAELASEYSVVNPDRAGAIGGVEGSTETRPVGRAALPTGVASGAFALRGPGLTEVIQSGGRYYIVEVEDYLPAQPRPFEEVEEEVREDALVAKRNAELERALENLRENAAITVPETAAFAYDDRAVARVGGQEIMASELARATYGNQQIQQFLTPENASIISGFFKPTILNQLIEEELAYQGARELPVSFVGPRQQVASSALNFVSQDAEVTDEEIEAYYEANRSRFIVPASAVATRVFFDEQADAEAFRSALLDEETDTEAEALEAIATEHGGEVEDLGLVSPNMLSPEFDRVLFETDAFEELGDGREVSDVLVVREPVSATEADDTDTAEVAEAEDVEVEAETAEDETAEAAEDAQDDTAEATTDETADETADEMAEDETAEATADTEELETRERYAVLVATRTPETVRPLDEVREQVRSTLEAERQAELRQEWLDELRERIEVEELYAAQTAQPGLSFDPLDGLTAEEAEGLEVELLEDDEAEVESPEDAEAEDAELETAEVEEAEAEPVAPETAEPETAELETADVETTEGEELEDEADEDDTDEAAEADTGEDDEDEAPADGQ